MARRLTAQELAERDVPREIIERYLSPERTWIAPLRGVTVDGERCSAGEERREVVVQAVLGRENDDVRAQLRGKVAEADRRFRRAVA
jgi:hypothetical protein